MMETAEPGVSPPRPRTERGAAMVEFALVSVILFTIIFGLIEGGLLVRARNALNNSADEGARRGAIAGSAENADWQILRQLRARGTLAATDVNYVVVYRATASDAEPTPACAAGTPVNGECNIYEESDFGVAEGAFDCGDANLDGSWCPGSRAQDGVIEYLGVYIDATHSGITGVFGDIDMQSRSVLPIEESAGGT